MKQRFIFNSAVPFLLLLTAIIALVTYSDKFAADLSEEAQQVTIRAGDAFRENDEVWQFEQALSEGNKALQNDSLYAEAVIAYRQRRLRSSENRFLALLNTHGADPELLNYLGLISMKQNEIVAARDYFETALTTDSTYLPAMTNLGLLYSKLENYRKADSLYRRAYRINPNYLKPRLNKGIMHCRMGEWSDATATLDSAVLIASGRDKSKALAYRGMARFNLLDTAGAQQDFNVAIERAPDYTLPRVYLALTAPLSETRIDEMDKVIALEPDYAPAHFYKGILLEQAGLKEAAQQAFEQALSLNPADREISGILGSFYIENDLIEYAEDYFDQVFRNDSLSPQRYFYEAKMASRRDDNDEAIAFYEKAITESGGNYAEAYLNEAVLLKREGRFAEAIKAYRKAIELREHYEEAWYNLALTYRAIGDNAQAIECYRKAIEINPAATKAMYNLAFVLNEQGSSAKALDWWKRIIAIDPDYLKAWYNLGLYYLREEAYAESIETYQRMLDRFPSYSKAWFNLAVAQKESGAIEEAVSSYERAIDIDPTYDAAWKNLGAIEAQRENVDRSIELFEQAIDLDAKDPEIRFNLALQLKKKGELRGALLQVNKAVQLRPSYLKAIELWKSLAEELGDYMQQLMAESRIVALSNDAEEAYDIGRRFHKKNRFKDAVEWYTIAEERGKNNEWVAYWRAKALEEAGDVQRAIDTYQLALQRDQVHKFSLYRLSMLAVDENDELARRCREKLIRNYPDFAAEKGITQ